MVCVWVCAVTIWNPPAPTRSSRAARHTSRLRFFLPNTDLVGLAMGPPLLGSEREPRDPGDGCRAVPRRGPPRYSVLMQQPQRPGSASALADVSGELDQLDLHRPERVDAEAEVRADR